MKAPDFIEARRRIESKPRSADDKLMDAATAVHLVRDGDHVAFGGCLFSRTPLVLIRELIRQKRNGLSISRNLIGFEAELLMVAGAVNSIVSSWQGIALRWGISKVLRQYVEAGDVQFEEWSHLGLGLRYRAAAMGVPFLPTLTMLGSDLMQVGGTRTIECPFTGKTLNLVPALFPDVAMLHVHRADRHGNCQIDGYQHMDADVARAATTVLVTAEEIMDDEDTRRHPERTAIPEFVVDAVVEAPRGAHPGECYGYYETDFDHFDEYVSAINQGGLDAVRTYLEKYVYGPSTQDAYLSLFPAEELERHSRSAQELVGADLGQ